MKKLHLLRPTRLIIISVFMFVSICSCNQNGNGETKNYFVVENASAHIIDSVQLTFENQKVTLVEVLGVNGPTMAGDIFFPPSFCPGEVKVNVFSNSEKCLGEKVVFDCCGCEGTNVISITKNQIELVHHP